MKIQQDLRWQFWKSHALLSCMQGSLLVLSLLTASIACGNIPSEHIKARAADFGLSAVLADKQFTNGYVQGSLSGGGDKYIINLTGNYLINFFVTATQLSGHPLSASVSRSGKVIITAELARLIMDGLINMKGIPQAKSANIHNGDVFLTEAYVVNAEAHRQHH